MPNLVCKTTLYIPKILEIYSFDRDKYLCKTTKYNNYK